MSVDQAYNFRRIDERVATSGVVSAEQLQQLKTEGYQAVINLLPESSEYAVAEEAQLVRQQGLEYHYIPVDFAAPTVADYRAFTSAMDELIDRKVLVHCAANYRVSAFYAIYAHRELGWTPQQAQDHIASIWNPGEHPPWADLIQELLAA